MTSQDATEPLPPLTSAEREKLRMEADFTCRHESPLTLRFDAARTLLRYEATLRELEGRERRDPSPDTQRLDWLERNGQRIDLHGAAWYCLDVDGDDHEGATLREAIDAAMSALAQER